MKKNIIKRTVLLLAIVVLVFGAFFTNKLIIKASVSRNSMSILEIEPTDRFSLTQTQGSATSGVETISNISNMAVTIRHITMAEYISNVEQINGKYDVVVIGNNNTSSSVTYSAEFGNSKPRYLPYGKEAYNTTSSPTTLGMLNDSRWAGTRNSNGTPDQKTYIEYYSENDITNKRANEILDSINSGQLVYIANEALSNTGTKIYSNFNSLTNGNLVKINQAQMTLNSIVDKYINGTAKRSPVLSIASQSKNNDRNINFVYNIATDNEEQNMTVSLYLDLNGDGLFKDKEKVKTIQNINTSNTQYNNGIISYKLDDQFVGNLTWKLEVVTSGNVKTYKTGVIDFQADPNHKPIVRVLQVYPVSTNGISNSFNLTNNSIINSLITNLRDYNLQIAAKSTTEFNNDISSGNKLNSNYDMIILGFADSYAYNDLPQTSINEIKSFISTGQSVMFTHDTVTYRYLSYPDTTSATTIKPTVDSTDKSSKNITHNFRDIIGQSRYVDPYNPTEVDIYKNFNVSTGKYDARNIPHEQLKSSDQGKVSLGMTKGLLSMFESSATAGSYSGESTSVYKINDGLINQYPYRIGYDADISVAPTHYQWYQLNLEDPDVVPWFTLKPSGNGYNQYDARNYYYTYSKGNITYSGTGHSGDSTRYTTDECKLFVNTMVKAERGANHAPTLQVNLNDGAKVSRNQSSIDFNFIPTDRDNDPINADVTVRYGTNLIQTYSYSNKKQGEAIPVSIPNSVFKNVSGNGITITVKASDPLLAEVSQTYTINLVSDPTVSLSLSYDKTGYLVGDVATVRVVANSNQSTQGLQTTLSNITYNITGKYNSEDVQVTSGGDSISFNNVVFSPAANPSSQTSSFTFLTKKSGQISIDGVLSYNQTNTTSPGGGKYKIGLPVRDGQATVRILTGNNSVAMGTAQVDVYKDGTKVNTVSFNSGSTSIYNITTGVYTFKLSNVPDGYQVDQSEITKSFDFNNNAQDIEFVANPIAEISHGLYTNNSLITENINLTKSSNATFGVIFKTKDLTPSIAFDLDDSITNVTVDKFKLFRMNGDGTITQITDCNITKLTETGNKFTVAFSNTETDSKYLIQYSVKLGNNNSYTNNVTLNGTSRPITITCQDLQDLF
ncbi:hypothetical protein CSC2_30350 [Clostridium zeae]|uniref:DUF5057 domain-containing protein n=1 Tax=Clostridium zeae TaxID=2759022 RepID=A0ABQ1ECG5_9CLOT|nr:DUF5057 domain-containing protein [Clostridium zeae]GFZ32509.1 hypothetical protein CSC2_30350 [Clostridium zeae]